MAAYLIPGGIGVLTIPDLPPNVTVLRRDLDQVRRVYGASRDVELTFKEFIRCLLPILPRPDQMNEYVWTVQRYRLSWPEHSIGLG